MAENDNPGIPPVPPQVPPPGVAQEPPPSPGTPQAAAPQGQGTNVLAILGLVAGVLSILLILGMIIPLLGVFFAGAGALLATLAIVLSVMGRKAAYRGVGGQGTAMGGLILGIIGLSFSVLFGTCQAICWSGVKNESDRVKAMSPEDRERMEKQRAEFRKQFNLDMKQALEERKKEAAAKDAPEPAEPKDPEPADPKAGASPGDSPKKQAD